LDKKSWFVYVSDMMAYHGLEAMDKIIASRWHSQAMKCLMGFMFLLASLRAGSTEVGFKPSTLPERMVEWTIESHKRYADPFNDVDVDVIFERSGHNWRVPMFWRGENRWTVRFAPPEPGEYKYRLDSTDKANPDLNGHPGRVAITAYSGPNQLFTHGMIRVSRTRRYFEQADGTPFFWLGDTWWNGLSDRLSWEEFQQLAQDRKEKGFSVVQLCGGLVPDEEVPPTDPGFCNEGGCVWEQSFKRINPQYFDYADRRIRQLLNDGLVPAIVGGWNGVLVEMGVHRMKQHWRYLIARYGAYPVFWIAGGEVYDPPASQHLPGLQVGGTTVDLSVPGWTEVVRFVRATDPYHHPLTVHELPPPFDSAIQDESLTDFDLFQVGHEGWPGIATEVALLNKHYARRTVTKPLVIGEIGYEGLAATHWEDFQRAGFWIGMLNGAAGYTYGAVGTWEAYSADKSLQREKLSFMTWREGMNLAGSSQIGLGSKLLRQYAWWRFQPHPEWVTPHGTTLLEPNNQVSGFDIDLLAALTQENPPPEEALPLGEWHNSHGNWRLPYAAGIPKEVRVIYMPSFGFNGRIAPVIHGLEVGVRYHSYYWEPSQGIKFDLGVIEPGTAGAPGKVDINHLERNLYDAHGGYRGELRGPGWIELGGKLRGSGWSDYGSHQHVDGDTYQPEIAPTLGDWVLVLETLK
jgi:hypothetical protein